MNKSQTEKQVITYELVKNVFSNCEAKTTFLNTNDVIVQLKGEHKIGQEGMISLMVHAYQMKKLAVILKPLKYQGLSVSTFDHAHIDQSVSTDLNLHFRSND